MILLGTHPNVRTAQCLLVSIDTPRLGSDATPRLQSGAAKIRNQIRPPKSFPTSAIVTPKGVLRLAKCHASATRKGF